MAKRVENVWTSYDSPTCLEVEYYPFAMPILRSAEPCHCGYCQERSLLKLYNTCKRRRICYTHYGQQGHELFCSAACWHNFPTLTSWAKKPQLFPKLDFRLTSCHFMSGPLTKRQGYHQFSGVMLEAMHGGIARSMKMHAMFLKTEIIGLAELWRRERSRASSSSVMNSPVLLFVQKGRERAACIERKRWGVPDVLPVTKQSQPRDQGQIRKALSRHLRHAAMNLNLLEASVLVMGSQVVATEVSKAMKGTINRKVDFVSTPVSDMAVSCPRVLQAAPLHGVAV
eukprot:1139508-Pelagomonas_calceolata.AAC.5